MSIFSLTIHADYRCRHSGVCCTADWDVPIELPLFRSLGAALSARRIQPVGVAHDAGPPFVTDDNLPDGAGAMFARTQAGACVFFEGGSNLCTIHRDAGETLLPATCRHFPRLAVRDRRGTFISLTHYCPTAAAMLFRDDVPLAIVAAPPAFPANDYDGLDVPDDAWPPLLHPRVLMDFEGYGAWERHMVARCASRDLTPDGVVATLMRDARALRGFVPDGRSLIGAVAALPNDVVMARPPERLDSSLAERALVLQAVPDDLKPGPDEERLDEAWSRAVRPHWDEWRAPLNRYLAAKAFANWTAYQGRGVLSIVRGLEAALALVRVEASRQCRDTARALDRDLLLEAFRGADFMLNHLAAGDELASSWSRVEAEPPVPSSKSAMTGP